MNEPQNMTIREMLLYAFAITAACIVLLSPAACTMNRHRIVAEAIKAGADPTAAKCAIEGDQGNMPACILIAAQPARR